MVDPKKELERFCEGKGKSEAAEQLGITRQHLDRLLKGQSEIGEKVLTALGISRDVRYTKD